MKTYRYFLILKKKVSGITVLLMGLLKKSKIQKTNTKNLVSRITKLTEKFQTTIPLEIRQKLNLSKGDSVRFQVSDKNEVILEKVNDTDYLWLKSLEGTLSEWNSENDNEAYDDL